MLRLLAVVYFFAGAIITLGVLIASVLVRNFDPVVIALWIILLLFWIGAAETWTERSHRTFLQWIAVAFSGAVTVIIPALAWFFIFS